MLIEIPKSFVRKMGNVVFWLYFRLHFIGCISEMEVLDKHLIIKYISNYLNT